MSRILKFPEVVSRVRMSKTTIYELVGEGMFPSPIHLTPRAVGWLETEVEAWLNARIKESRRGSKRGQA